ncbi:hypothetical protein L6452_18084 [Arctium lappa]|uniref:Uncharacterized protein n=1 Tax=Arctium lappa TaxID=4217 RepID=A0ACB9C568_ARCLA|nr:hypothetical protein L6452_18084 [Arctium lappa]
MEPSDPKLDEMAKDVKELLLTLTTVVVEVTNLASKVDEEYVHIEGEQIQTIEAHLSLAERTVEDDDSYSDDVELILNDPSEPTITTSAAVVTIDVGDEECDEVEEYDVEVDIPKGSANLGNDYDDDDDDDDDNDDDDDDDDGDDFLFQPIPSSAPKGISIKEPSSHGERPYQQKNQQSYTGKGKGFAEETQSILRNAEGSLL